MTRKIEIYLIADFSRGIGRIEEALKCGVDMIQLREKDISSREYLEKARELRKLTNYYQVSFIVNDRIDIALLSGADGVHLGQSDIPIDEARELLQHCTKEKRMLIGATARTVEQAVQAQEQGADYIGTGAWFATKTKKDAVSLSEDTYKAILDHTSIPNVAVGGITSENCHIPFSYGAAGVAVSAGILDSSDMKRTINTMRKVSRIYESKAFVF